MMRLDLFGAPASSRRPTFERRFRLQSSERLPRIDADGGALRLTIDTDVAAA